jgi:hypothetical protein
MATRLLRAGALPSAGLFLLLLSVGCTGKGSISGRVTLDGKPLPLGTITFHSEEGRHDVFNASIRDGSYAIDGVQAGKARVTIVSVDPARVGAAAASTGQAGGSDVKPRAAPAATPGFVAVPERYANPEQSGLTWQVLVGAQVYDVDLKP